MSQYGVLFDSVFTKGGKNKAASLFRGIRKKTFELSLCPGDENRGGYSGNRKGKGAVCPNTEEWDVAFEALCNDKGLRDDLKNQNP